MYKYLLQSVDGIQWFGIATLLLRGDSAGWSGLRLYPHEVSAFLLSQFAVLITVTAFPQTVRWLVDLAAKTPG